MLQNLIAELLGELNYSEMSLNSIQNVNMQCGVLW